jgi:hypothetical protein
LDATVGINYLVLPNLEFDLFTGYKFINNEHFYVVNNYYSYLDNFLMGHRTIPQYAKGQTFKIGGKVKYSWQDIFDVGLQYIYYDWKIKEYLDDMNPYDYEMFFAWNKPQSTADLNIGFKVPAIPLKFDLLYHGEFGRKASFHTSDMKDINDLSFKGTYSINKTISVYMAIHNLLFQKYDLWYGYPAQNFNIMGGINVKF